MANYFAALLLTIFVEFLVLAFFIKRPLPRILLYTILINCFTLPIATFIYNSYGNFWVVEGLVVFVESVFILALFEIPYRQALKISSVVNLLTALLSILKLL